MRPDEAATLLRRTELFGHVGDDGLLRIAERSTTRRYKKGHLVFRQGDPGHCLFVLVDGLVKVVVTSEQGEEMVLVTLEPPATFGELAVIDGRPRSASVEVIEPATVLSLERSTLLELIDRQPAVREGLLRSLGGLLRRLTDQASDFVFLDLQGRVAKLLVRLAESQPGGGSGETVLDLRLTQGDLAHMVGGSRQRVNQILRSLEDRGYLELRSRKILVKDLEHLRRRAGL